MATEAVLPVLHSANYEILIETPEGDAHSVRIQAHSTWQGVSAPAPGPRQVAKALARQFQALHGVHVLGARHFEAQAFEANSGFGGLSAEA